MMIYEDKTHIAFLCDMSNSHFEYLRCLYPSDSIYPTLCLRMISKGHQIEEDNVYRIQFKDKKIAWIERHYLIDEPFSGMYGTSSDYKKGMDEKADKVFGVLEKMVKEGNLPKEFIEHDDL